MSVQAGLPAQGHSHRPPSRIPQGIQWLSFERSRTDRHQHGGATAQDFNLFPFNFDFVKAPKHDIQNYKKSNRAENNLFKCAKYSGGYCQNCPNNLKRKQ